MILNPPITGFTCRVTGSPIPWLPGHALLCVTHFNVAVPYAEVHYIRPDGTQTILGRSETLEKDDSGCAIPMPDGSVILYASEAAVAGGSGSTSEIHPYVCPGKIPACVAPAGTIDNEARILISALQVALSTLISHLHSA